VLPHKVQRKNDGSPIKRVEAIPGKWGKRGEKVSIPLVKTLRLYLSINWEAKLLFLKFL